MNHRRPCNNHNPHKHHGFDRLSLLELNEAIHKIDKLTNIVINTRNEDQHYKASVENSLRKELEYQKKIADLEYEQNNKLARFNNEAERKLLEVRLRNAEELLRIQKANNEAAKILASKKITNEFKDSIHRSGHISKWNSEINRDCKCHNTDIMCINKCHASGSWHKK